MSGSIRIWACLLLATFSQAADKRPGRAVEFVRIPAGEFLMGCSAGDTKCPEAEMPAHRVRISKSFEIGRYEVTQAQWEAVMGSNPSFLKGADYPVEQIMPNDADEFLKRLNARKDGYLYRLPTEAEWEYAARAGNASPYTDTLEGIGWFDENSGGQTRPVGQKKPNAWGLYDTIGNVWEWVSDWYDAGFYKTSPATDPTGPAAPTNSHVRRGGAWNTNKANSRVSFRQQNAADLHVLGIRLVRVAR